MKQLMRKKAVRVIAIFLVVILLIGVGGTGYYFGFMHPYRGTVSKTENSLELDSILTKKQAYEDLNYIYKRLQNRHPAWLEKDSSIPSQVKVQYEAELAGFDENITVLQLWQAASRMTAVMKDGHTRVSWSNTTQSRYIDDFAFLREHGKPAAINGVPAATVLESYKKCNSFELDAYAENQFYGNAICSESGLRICGIDTAKGVEMTFSTPRGEITKHFDFVPFEQVKGIEILEKDQKWVSYTIDKDKKVGIFTLKSCKNNEEYRKVLDQFFAEVLAAGITNIAVDLRGNGGGNSSVANEFLRNIDIDTYQTWASASRYGWHLQKHPASTIVNSRKDAVFQGNLYVLTDITSYSSAMNFAMLVSDNQIGTLVGQASGNLPDSYGDILFFQTPNAMLTLTVSYKKWYRVDQSKKNQPIKPDYEVPSQHAMDKVYDLIASGTPGV